MEDCSVFSNIVFFPILSLSAHDIREAAVIDWPTRLSAADDVTGWPNLNPGPNFAWPTGGNAHALTRGRQSALGVSED